MLFSMDDNGNVGHRFATYFGARLLTQEWLQPGDEVHEMYTATSNARNAEGEELITAYAVHRPDGLWSVLLINKDPKRAFQTDVVFRNAAGAVGAFDGRLDIFQYSGKQYLLGGPAGNPHPVRADEPEHRVIESSMRNRKQFSLPPYSLSVIRGALDRISIK
jgi:hypothetical protein